MNCEIPVKHDKYQHYLQMTQLLDSTDVSAFNLLYIAVSQSDAAKWQQILRQLVWMPVLARSDLSFFGVKTGSLGNARMTHANVGKTQGRCLKSAATLRNRLKHGPSMKSLAVINPIRLFPRIALPKGVSDTKTVPFTREIVQLQIWSLYQFR